MKRFVAVLAAVVMIGAGLWIRSAREQKTVATGSSGGSAREVKVACVTELQDACIAAAAVDSRIDLRIEDAAATAVSIAQGRADLDGWITLEPWGQIANELAGSNVVQENPAAMGNTQLVLAMVKERAAALAQTCPAATIDWNCLVQHLDQPWSTVPGADPLWGSITLGLPDRDTAVGLLLLGSAASTFFGRSDFATNDFSQPGFDQFRAAVVRAEKESPPFTQFVQQFPAAYSAVGATEADTTTGLGVHAPDVQIIRGDPAATTGAVGYTLARSAHDGEVKAFALSRAMRDALASEGWSPDGPPGNGLPNPGVLLALSDLAK